MNQNSKNMNTEQKARAYDRAIKRAKKWYDANTNEGYRGIFEDIFPKLKESEDEKIRKWLLNFVQGLPDEGLDFHFYNLKKEQVIAWLEKQGEQKHNPVLDIEKKELKKIEEKHAENKGMNLVEEEMTPFQKKVFRIIDTAIEEEQGLKQVCDELFTLASNEIEQKPAEWSEEDEKIFGSFLHKLEVCDLLSNKEIIWAKRWLKSLRPQYHWKPTEKQLYMLNWLATNVLDDGVTGKPAKEVLYSLYEQLKQL